jgi:general secretion pathway protein K
MAGRGEAEPEARKPGIFNRLGDERGMVLLIAIVVVVLLVTLIVEFDYGTRVSLTTAGTFRNGTQATFLAKSGVRAAQAVLKEDGKTPPAVDHLEEFWATPVPPYPIGGGLVSIYVEDESSKLNINLLSKPTDVEKWGPVWKRFLEEVLQIDQEVFSAIKDWVDEDDLSEDLYGAESGYYQQLDPPYRAKNGPLDSLGELLLIKGVTREVYRKLTQGCDGGPCVTFADTKKINLNTTSVPVCRALDEELTEELCERLVEGRPLENIEGDLEAVAGWGGTGGIRFKLKSFGMIDVRTEFFSVRSIGEVQETRRVAEALIYRKGASAKLLRWRAL